MMKKTILWVVAGLIGLFLLIQLVPYGRNHTNPPVAVEPKWDSPQTRSLAQQACFDCHSNLSRWPLYANVAPVSWLVYNDVMEGRSKLNFSEWDRGYQPSIGEIVGEIQEGGMPLPQYLLMHPNARLSDADRQALATGLNNSLK